jgi:hypothetical protein
MGKECLSTCKENALEKMVENGSFNAYKISDSEQQKML